ncbi:CLUMA_CG000819, isoform A [Clunio marinus]|uniref:CLUMA_CG000819, isoform A n=1 Tax=Clunio marinus TaxID=568069 RepID=A0A1J1HHX3_9DIPT|nr:CLUMA_CG000819, isoform A [Clunio marinus]
MSALKNSVRLMASVRQFSRTAIRNEDSVHPGYKKIKLIQEQFQKPDGLPVHLKGGTMDRVLLGITTVLCLVGIGMGVELIYDLANPPKNN